MEKAIINGVLLVDKPTGPTSFAVINKIKKMFRPKKIGHAGTLDPAATGLLMVCLGEATKVSSYLMDSEKTYEFEIFFGRQTDTLDDQGKTTALDNTLVDEDTLRAALKTFEGPQSQVPPKYSAIKVKGKKLYEYARRDHDVDIPRRDIHILDLQLLDFNFPVVKCRVRCSKGTYVRALARDIAHHLGTLGIARHIHRVHSGNFTLEMAHRLEDVLNWTLPDLTAALKPIEWALKDLPSYQANAQEMEDLKCGRRISCKAGNFSEGATLLLMDPDQKAQGLLSYASETLKIKRGFF